MAWNEGIKTFSAGEVLAPYRRVKLSSGTVIYADADDVGIGVSLNKADALGDHVAVKLFNCGGTFEIEASGVITPGEEIYASNDGKVQGTPGVAGTYYKIGLAFEAASGDGAVIECYPDDMHKEVTVL